MGKITSAELRDLKKSGADVTFIPNKVSKKVKPPTVVVKPDTTVINAQIEATKAMTNASIAAINNPKLDKILELLLKPKKNSKANKRLTINRDKNLLITSIDIKEI